MVKHAFSNKFVDLLMCLPCKYDMQMQGRPQEETVKHFNEGITLYEIMQDLPESIKQEIQGAQPALGVFL